MQSDYYINNDKGKTEAGVAAERLAQIERLLTDSDIAKARVTKKPGRNLLTRSLDFVFALMREYAPPVHWLGAGVLTLILYSYARLVAFTGRLCTSGERRWPDVSHAKVVALWHRDAPSLLVAYAMSRPKVPCSIMISGDSRGDSMAMLCRLLGLRVVRGDSEAGGWQALRQLSDALINGSCVFLTADGGGPARVAKVGAVALASATSAPLVPLAADSYPAIEERHKWDGARNPLPFSSVVISLGTPRTFEPLVDATSIEHARIWLEDELQRMSSELGANRNADLG